MIKVLEELIEIVDKLNAANKDSLVILKLLKERIDHIETRLDELQPAK